MGAILRDRWRHVGTSLLLVGVATALGCAEFPDESAGATDAGAEAGVDAVIADAGAGAADDSEAGRPDAVVNPSDVGHAGRSDAARLEPDAGPPGDAVVLPDAMGRADAGGRPDATPEDATADAELPRDSAMDAAAFDAAAVDASPDAAPIIALDASADIGTDAAPAAPESCMWAGGLASLSDAVGAVSPSIIPLDNRRAAVYFGYPREGAWWLGRGDVVRGGFPMQQLGLPPTGVAAERPFGLYGTATADGERRLVAWRAPEGFRTFDNPEAGDFPRDVAPDQAAAVPGPADDADARMDLIPTAEGYALVYRANDMHNAIRSLTDAGEVDEAPRVPPPTPADPIFAVATSGGPPLVMQTAAGALQATVMVAELDGVGGGGFRPEARPIPAALDVRDVDVVWHPVREQYLAVWSGGASQPGLYRTTLDTGGVAQETARLWPEATGRVRLALGPDGDAWILFVAENTGLTLLELEGGTEPVGRAVVLAGPPDDVGIDLKRLDDVPVAAWVAGGEAHGAAGPFDCSP